MSTYPHTVPSRQQLVGEALRLDAELSVLTLYDDARSPLGHDFGNGQRFRELIRVRRERDAARHHAKMFGYGMGLGDLDATPEQVVAAYRRIAVTKTQRYAREPHVTRTAQLAHEAWRRVGREVEAIVADPGLITPTERTR